MSDTIHLNDELNNVEFENDATVQSNSFIDNISYDSVIFIFIIFIIFNSIYVYSGTYFPSSFNQTSIYYPLIQDYSNDIATVNILLEPLHVFHKFINMDGKAIRHSTKYPIENNLILDGKLIHLKDGLVVDESTIQPHNITSYFQIGVEKSSQFHVFKQPIYSSFNGLNISLVFKSGFYNIRGFEFTYTFSDTAKYNSLINTKKLILSSTACYALIGFIFCLKGNSLSTNDIFAIILGITAVLAPNPLALIANNKFISFLSILLPTVFFTVFRSYQVNIVISILNRKNRFSQQLTSICLIIIIFYGVCEFCNSSNKIYSFMSDSHELTPFELTVIFMHMLYAATLCFSFGYNFYSTSQFSTDNKWHFKSAVYGIFSLVTTASMLATEVVLPISGFSNDSEMGTDLYISSHIFASIVFMFLIHPVDSSDNQKNVQMKIDPANDNE